MTAAQVELLYPEHYYEPVPKPRTAAKGELSSAMMQVRDGMVVHMRKELRALDDMTKFSTLSALAWEVYRREFKSLVVPIVLAEFGRGMHQAHSGRVPEKVLAPLAEQYVETMGDYFNQTSNEAMLEGFNAYVNKKVPVKAAAERALDNFGLTRRQTRSVVAADTLENLKISTVRRIDPKRQIKAFIGTALRDRFKIFEEEELFRANQHARQLVWLYEHKQGRLPPGTRRIWITADDEKVCPQCGPLHNMRAPVDEPFHTGEGDVWTPGLHVNCRCEVRLWVPTVTLIRKDDDDDWDPEDHPKWPKGAEGGRGGEFRPKRGSRRGLPTRGKPVLEPDPFLGERIEQAAREVQAPARAPQRTEAPARTEAPQRNEPLRRTETPTRAGAPTRAEAPTRTETPARTGPVRISDAPIREVLTHSRSVRRIVHDRDMRQAEDAAAALARQFALDARTAPIIEGEPYGLHTPMGISEMVDENYPIADWDEDKDGNKLVVFKQDVSISDIEEIVSQDDVEHLAREYESERETEQWYTPLDIHLKLPSQFGPYAEFHIDDQLDPEDVDQIREIRQQVQKMLDKEERGWPVDWERTTFMVPGIVAGSDKGSLDGQRAVRLPAGFLMSAFNLSPSEDAEGPSQFVYVFSAIAGSQEDVESESGTTYGYSYAKVRAGQKYKVTGERRVGPYYYIYLRPE